MLARYTPCGYSANDEGERMNEYEMRQERRRERLLAITVLVVPDPYAPLGA
jgi:hypothetical protein